MESTGVHLFRGIDNDWAHVGKNDADDDTDEHPHHERVPLELIKWAFLLLLKGGRRPKHWFWRLSIRPLVGFSYVAF